MIISSRQDKTVPAPYQDRVIQAYGGESQIVALTDANHTSSLNLVEQREYSRHLDWLRNQAIGVSRNDYSVTRSEGLTQFEDGRSSRVDRHNVTG